MARTILAKKTTRLLRLACAHERGLISWSQLDELLGKRREMLLARRQFIKMAGAGLPLASGLLASACKSTNNAEGLSAEVLKDQGRVVIVGGGAAGLTTAYRLAQAGVACTIYEGSERLGGRMYTENNFNAEGQFCERGGELVDTIHDDLRQLCTELGLKIQELDEGNDLAEETFIFGGQDRTEKDIIAAFQPLAQAIIRDTRPLYVNGQKTVPTYNSELAKHPDVRRLDQLSIAAYLDSVPSERWLRDLVDLSYMSMMGGECSEQSALNLLTLIDPDTSKGLRLYGDSDESKRIQGGNENLPRALVKKLEGRVPMHKQHRLLAVRDGGREFLLTFENNGRPLEVKADRLVIAIPFSTLRQVEFNSVQLTPAKARAIKEWGYGTNSKFMMGFRSRPWRTGPRHSAGSVFGDFTCQCFWETSYMQEGKSGIITNFLSGRRGATAWPSQQVTALQQLDAVFAGTAKEFDGNKVLQHWPTHPFTLMSYTSMKPGQYTAFYGAGAEAELGGRLYFAGEHCSVDFSGYMNGAVQSGNQTASALLANRV